MEENNNSKASKAKKFLEKKAANRKTTYYSEVMCEIHTSRRWIGSILIQVASLCHDKNEPILSSLVEFKNGGGVGNGYEYVVANYGASQDFRKEQEKCFCHWGKR